MANIGVLLDLDQGHIYPALGIAKKLTNLGHETILLGIPDVETYVREYGFQFHSIFEKVYPKGFLEVHRQMQRFSIEANGIQKITARPHINSILNGELPSTIAKLDLDLLIVTHSLCLETLVLYYKCPELKFIILTTWLRDSHLSPRFQCESILKVQREDMKSEILSFCESKSIKDVSAPLDGMPEMVACPKEFDLPEVNYNTETHFLNSCIRASVESTSFMNSINVPEGKKVLYASLGSQAVLFAEKAEKFCKLMLEFMELDSSSDFFLILSKGKDFTFKIFKSVPKNIKIVEWAHQLEVLKHSSLVISHGGLGTIKETISYCTPLLIIPMVNDEFNNGKRVEYHGLGKSANLENLNPAILASKVKEILNSSDIQENLKEMQKVFNKDDTSKFRNIIDNQLI